MTNQDKIINHFFTFYKEIFQSEGNKEECITAREIIKKLIPKNIFEEDVADLSKPISSEEIRKAITTINNDKSPGLDGISIEFYKAFTN